MYWIFLWGMISYLASTWCLIKFLHFKLFSFLQAFHDITIWEWKLILWWFNIEFCSRRDYNSGKRYYLTRRIRLFWMKTNLSMTMINHMKTNWQREEDKEILERIWACIIIYDGKYFDSYRYYYQVKIQKSYYDYHDITWTLIDQSPDSQITKIVHCKTYGINLLRTNS